MLTSLRLTRLKQGYKVKDIANKLNVSSTYISAVERNRESPSKEFRKKLSRVLNTAEGKLFPQED